jgi:hypothetical protein
MQAQQRKTLVKVGVIIIKGSPLVVSLRNRRLGPASPRYRVGHVHRIRRISSSNLRTAFRTRLTSFSEHNKPSFIPKQLPRILPWRENATNYIPRDGSKELVMDGRCTSCFVIKCGIPSEISAHELWEEHEKLALASSANPLGKGNSRRIAGTSENASTTKVTLFIVALSSAVSFLRLIRVRSIL